MGAGDAPDDEIMQIISSAQISLRASHAGDPNSMDRVVQARSGA